MKFHKKSFIDDNQAEMQFVLSWGIIFFYLELE